MIHYAIKTLGKNSAQRVCKTDDKVGHQKVFENLWRLYLAMCIR